MLSLFSLAKDQELVLCSREFEAALQRVTVGTGSTTLLPSKSPLSYQKSAFADALVGCNRRLDPNLVGERVEFRCV